jgi:hypothetical protein
MSRYNCHWAAQFLEMRMSVIDAHEEKMIETAIRKFSVLKCHEQLQFANDRSLATHMLMATHVDGTPHSQTRLTRRQATNKLSIECCKMTNVA